MKLVQYIEHTRLRFCYLKKNLDWTILFDILKAAFRIQNQSQ
jgi:hypothetical protein